MTQPWGLAELRSPPPKPWSPEGPPWVVMIPSSETCVILHLQGIRTCVGVSTRVLFYKPQQVYEGGLLVSPVSAGQETVLERPSSPDHRAVSPAQGVGSGLRF